MVLYQTYAHIPRKFLRIYKQCHNLLTKVTLLWYIVTRGENMDENLITKKELLELTGISYGALYRWKRMQLLPDDWFIRRSTFTGHETFFPREKVLQRVREIQEMKTRMSLEEIAAYYQPGVPAEVSMTPGEAAEAGISAPPVINQYLALRPLETFAYEDLLGLYIFSELLKEGMLSRDETFEASQAALSTGEVSEPVVYLVRKYGVAFCVTAGEMQKIIFDSAATVAKTLVVSGYKAALGELLSQKGVTQ